MIANLATLMDMAVSTDTSREAVRACDILWAGNPEISLKVVEDHLSQFSERAFAEDAPALVLTRFLEICRETALADAHSFVTSCNFMDKLYENIKVPVVWLFFDRIFTGRDRHGVFQEELLRKGDSVRAELAETAFPDRLFELAKTDDEDQREIVLRLLALMGDKIRRPELVEKLFDRPEKHSVVVDNAWMDALNEITGEETYDSVLSHLKSIVSMLEVDDTKRFHVFQCTAFDVLMKLLELNGSKTAAMLLELGIPDIVGNLVREFPFHANLQGRIRALVNASLVDQKLRDAMFKAVLPTYREALMEGQRQWVHGWSLMRSMRKDFADNAGLKDAAASAVEWDMKLEEKIGQWDALETSEYGGSVPEKPEIPLSMLAALGLDPQMLMMLKFLQSRK